MPTVTVKEAIENQLLQRLGRQWQVGDRLPPIRELARSLNAGQSNTHEAIKRLTAEGLLKSRQRAGTFVVRVPEVGSLPVTKNVLQGKVLTMITFSPRTLGFVSTMTDAFTAEALANDAIVNHVDIESKNSTCTWPEDADAVAIFNPSRRFVIPESAWQPVVVASTAWSVVSGLPERVDAVGVNDEQGGTLAGQQIAGQSAEDVGFIGVATDWPEGHRLEVVSATRLAGFEAGWGRSLLQENLLTVQGHSVLSGGKAFGHYRRMERKPRIIFAATDDLAVGFAAAASAEGLRAGHDFHIIGFDGQERGRHLVDGSLSTVAVPTEQMGMRLVHLLRERFKDPARPVHRLQLDCSFHVGSTTSFSREG